MALVGMAIAVVCLAFAAAPMAARSDDVAAYERIGSSAAVWSGNVASEYPPAASAVFELLAAGRPHGIAFSSAWVVLIAIVAFSAAAWAKYAISRERALQVLFSFLATTMLLGVEIVWDRYDIVIGLLLLLAWMAHRHDRFAAAGFLLALGGALKLVPFFLLPILYLRTRPVSRRRFITGVVAGGLGGFIVPLLLMGPHGMLSNVAWLFRYHTRRGVQVESMPSGIAMLVHLWAGGRSPIGFSHESHENLEIGAGILRGLHVLAILGMLGYLVLAREKRERRDDAPLLASFLGWLLVTSTVLSTQYFAWILPLLLCWSVEQSWAALGPERRRAMALLAAACLLAGITHWLSPSHYLALVDQRDGLLTVLLNLRNLLLGVLTLAYLAVWLREEAPTDQVRCTESHAATSWRTKRGASARAARMRS